MDSQAGAPPACAVRTPTARVPHAQRPHRASTVHGLRESRSRFDAATLENNHARRLTRAKGDALMTAIDTNVAPATVVDRFGGCPTCGCNDGLQNVRFGAPIAPGISPPLTVAICKAHHVWWPIGLDRIPRDGSDSEERWVANATALRARYREVDPLARGSPIIPTTYA